jgi:hypothetical protein
MGFCLLFALQLNAFAWVGSSPSGHKGWGGYHYGGWHYWHGGPHYWPYWGWGWPYWGWGIFIAPPIGVVVSDIPFGYSTVVVGGVTYYYYNGVYYQACPPGYIVVPAPVPAPAPAPTPTPAPAPGVSSGEVTINVPNSDGSYTPVKLIKHDNGYIGPQGEYYPGNPTVGQLKALYGK